MKVRFWKGPFSGKVKELGGYGQKEVVFRDVKRMSRREQYKAMTEYFDTARYPYGYQPPIVEARYRMVAHPQHPGMPAMHPDGSYFYEYVEGSKREFPRS